MKPLAALTVLVVVPSIALGQTAPALRTHHVTLDAGWLVSGSYDVGRATAQLRGNTPGSAPASVPLFRADSRLNASAAPQIRVGFALTRRVAVEATAALARPRIGVSISGDPEASSVELPGERLEQYQLEGGLSWQLPRAFGRLAPFVSAGGGYLRQLHEDRTLAETGQVYYAGGGARFWLRGGSARSKAIGVRGDVRVQLRRHGIDFENKARVWPAASVVLFVGL